MSLLSREIIICEEKIDTTTPPSILTLLERKEKESHTYFLEGGEKIAFLISYFPIDTYTCTSQ